MEAIKMKTKIKDVRNNLIEIGNEAKKNYDETKDLKAALLAVKSYGEATRTAVAQIHYKRLTGMPIKVNFLEE
jgi:hypothetical protein